MIPIWVAVLIGTVFLSFSGCREYMFSLSWFRRCFFVGIGIFAFVEGLILYSGYQTGIGEEADYIIVLGASVRGENMSNVLYERAKKAFEYLQLHKDTKAVLSGGQGYGEDISESEAIRRYLVKKGIDDSRLLLEDQSTSTKENIKYSYEKIEKNWIAKEDEPEVIIITSRFHVFRSKVVARLQGKQPKGIGSASFPVLLPNYYLREFFGVFFEFVR